MPSPKLRLELAPKLELRVVPVQIQLQKLLALSQEELEQYLRAELENNPYLEEAPPDAAEASTSDAEPTETEFDSPGAEESALVPADPRATASEEHAELATDPFEAYTMFYHPPTPSTGEEEEEEEGDLYQPADSKSFQEELLEQLGLLNLSPEEQLLAEIIIGSLDDDGYLREELHELLNEANARIAELNAQRLQQLQPPPSDNPAWQYALDPIAAALVLKRPLPAVELLRPLTLEQAERLLKRLQRELDPPGVAARSLEECLLAQLESRPMTTDAERWAYRLVKEAFPLLSRRRTEELLRQHPELTPELLRDAFEVVRHLNPKPGSGRSTTVPLQITPDFLVQRDPETGELLITLNDASTPTIRFTNAMRGLNIRSRVDARRISSELRRHLRDYYTNAYTLPELLRRRKAVLLRVMTALVELQRDFFEHGPQALKPLTYRQVAERTQLDTSTICRVVSNKYVQTDYGIFALKELFTEALPNLEGEEVSTTVIKQKLREIIEAEDKRRPLSDSKVARKLQEMGFRIARRTVAKYREMLGIPEARLRRAIA
jgi:RNA polymerase sigma-54 factor